MNSSMFYCFSTNYNTIENNGISIINKMLLLYKKQKTKFNKPPLHQRSYHDLVKHLLKTNLLFIIIINSKNKYVLFS